MAVLLGGVLLVGLVLLGFVVGFFGDGWPFDDDDGHRISVDDERVAFDVELPDDGGIGSVSAPIHGADCPSVAYRAGDTVMIEAYSTTCSLDNGQIGNGDHGAYRELDDVPEPLDVAEVDTDLGVATVFTQEYFECTNSCDEWQEPVAIVTLDEPADRDFPTLVLISPKGELSREEFTEVVRSLEQPR